MKIKHSFLLLVIGIFTLALTSCNPSPEKCFDIAVLNSNMLVGFAGEGVFRELDQPSAILLEGTKDQTRPMKRKEVIDQKIIFLDEHFKKIKGLSETEDTKEMVQASRALYEYVLPVYKSDYQQLAKLYDDGASKEEVQSYTMAIYNKHNRNFEQLYNKLIEVGKLYAAKHKINVNWGS